MKRQLKNLNFYIILSADIGLAALAMIAYLLRFEFNLNQQLIVQLLGILIWLVPLKIFVFLIFRIYRGMWRYAGLADIWNLLRASTTASLLAVGVMVFVNRFEGYPRSVFLIDYFLTVGFCAGLRMIIRSVYQEGYSVDFKKWQPFVSRSPAEGKRILILGAGDSGEKTLREIKENPDLNIWVEGFLDDDVGKHGRSIHGVSVLGPLSKLPDVVKTHKIKEALIAMPAMNGSIIRQVVNLCEQANVSYRILPGIYELIDGKVSIKALRDVRYEDLLGREEIKLDVENITNLIKDKRVMITGAGGSIGSELCRQILKYYPAQLILIDANEANLYSIQMELKHDAKYLDYFTILGSVADRYLLDRIMQKLSPQVVFHSAAYKHVPILERNPWQAVWNNIHGTQNIIEMSVAHKVEDFVMISTDKAVRPTNVMGASKRVGELILAAHKGNGTRMTGVRFGNVVGSSGSVIPLFRSQIARGGPVTVTHPEVTRYFMTIPEACQLILQAVTLESEGEIFILKMGTPVKIADMARDLIRLSGKEPEKDVKIVFTGLRQGEKLCEELIAEGEGVVETEHEKVMVLKSNGDWHGLANRNAFHEWLFREIELLYQVAEKQDAEGIRKHLKRLVPEYVWYDSSGDCKYPNKT